MKLAIRDVYFIAIIVILCLVIFFKKGKTIPKEVNKEVINKVKIDSLLSAEKIKADSILLLKSKVIDLENQSKDLQKRIETNEQKLKRIKNEYTKKDSVVSNLNVVELQKFFTERYGN